MGLRELFRKSGAIAGQGRKRPAEGFGPVTLPLAAYYRRSDEFEARRREFYTSMARVYGFEGWKPAPTRYRPPAEPAGRNGSRSRRERYGDPALAQFRDPNIDAAHALRWKPELLNSEIAPPATDTKCDDAFYEGEVRRRALDDLDRLFFGAELSPLRSVDLEAVPSGGFGPRIVSDYKLDCQRAIQDMRNEIPPAAMALIERVVVRGEFIWEVPSKKARIILLQELRMALDFAAWSLGLDGKGRPEMTKDDLRRRWPEADEYFRQKILRPAMHAGKVIRSK